MAPNETNDTDSLFIDTESDEEEQTGMDHDTVKPWKIMIVDDETDIHAITKLTLSGLDFKGRPIEFVDAYSRQEAEKIMSEHSDIALILLDVVMEEDDAGLQFVRYVREKLKNDLVRIILRTGQPGMVPQGKVVISYDIDNYQEKTELTRERFLSVVVMALRSYYLLNELYKTQNKMKSYLKVADKFVPHKLLNILNKNSISEISVGDYVEEEMVVLFVNIQSATTQTANISSKECMQLINDCVSYLEPIISEHNGFIDKYVGDAIMALFYGTCDSAVESAIKMQSKIAEFNKIRAEKNETTVNLLISINSGKLILGTIGYRDHIDCTVISDTVNIAAKLEKLNKDLNSDILVTEQIIKTLKKPESFYYRKIGNFPIEGKNESISVYEIFNSNSDAELALKQQTSAQFSIGVQCFQEKKWNEAQSIFTEILKRNPHDNAVRYYQRKLGLIIPS